MAESKAEAKLLHYTKRAMHEYRMIAPNDRVLVCLSGGKDSFTLLTLLDRIRVESHYSFEIQSFTLDQGQPGWDETGLREWFARRRIPFEILRQDTYSIVKEKIPEGKTYCSLCSRLRRGIIYTYAAQHGFNKIALGHHRDDLIQTLLMSILYSGQVRSMPPKLLTDNKRHVVIRPLAFCQEKDIIQYASEQNFPIIPCNLCGSQANLTRKKVKQLIADLGADNPKVPSNILRAIANIKPSQMMDHALWNFKQLEVDQIREGDIEEPSVAMLEDLW
ncbi:MAG: tRNA 2-thiocytidine(32) synthetase TtcA [Gammaproteobacteria bacterium RIFCSPHIGHO2_12_FULL_45_9]|nr:MAG: tRNA 2-thiocytidine(32) synthetase TtcA [Gammaproteobacteria bacterium RIFCSPHIGHO2_12_FULL_45_9]